MFFLSALMHTHKKKTFIVIKGKNRTANYISEIIMFSSTFPGFSFNFDFKTVRYQLTCLKSGKTMKNIIIFSKVVTTQEKGHSLSL